MWVCKNCGSKKIGFAETKLYAVRKDGSVLENELISESSFVCLKCNKENKNIHKLATWVEKGVEKKNDIRKNQ